MAKVISFVCDSCAKIKNGYTDEPWWIVRRSDHGIVILPYVVTVYGDNDKLACGSNCVVQIVREYLDELRGLQCPTT